MVKVFRKDVIDAPEAFKGNEADNSSLPVMLPQIMANLSGHVAPVEEILADTGYSSGKAIRVLMANNVQGYIPNPGNYKSSREGEGFTYDAEYDRYTCLMSVHLTFRRIESSYNEPTVLKKIYESNISDCKNCPFKEICANKKGSRSWLIQRINHSMNICSGGLKAPKANR